MWPSQTPGAHVAQITNLIMYTSLNAAQAEQNLSPWVKFECLFFSYWVSVKKNCITSTKSPLLILKNIQWFFSSWCFSFSLDKHLQLFTVMESLMCRWGERAPPPGLTVSIIITPFIWQVMVTNVTSLLKTVKAVEDEATRGTRALEATIECIKQELTVRAPDRPKTLLYGLLGVNWWDTASLRSWLSEGQGYLCLLFWTKQGRFLFFFLYYPCNSSALPFLSAPAAFSQLLSGSE